MDIAKRLKMEFADKQKIRNCLEMAENFPSKEMFKYSHAQGFQNIILHRKYAFYFCKYYSTSLQKSITFSSSISSTVPLTFQQLNLEILQNQSKKILELLLWYVMHLIEFNVVFYG